MGETTGFHFNDIFQMIHHSNSKYLLIWVTAFIILPNLSSASAVKRHRRPSEFPDPCKAICQGKVMVPCVNNCDHDDFECNKKCKEKYDKCIQDCKKEKKFSEQKILK